MYMTENFQQDLEDLYDINNLLTSPSHSHNTIPMIIEQQLPQHHHHPNGETGQNRRPGPSFSFPKKRAETWIREETRTLIKLRRERGSLFNTSKSNKHLWESISMEMKERGFERSPNMCTDKWRNLVKEFKKAKKNNDDENVSDSAKMRDFKEIEAFLKEKSNNVPPSGGESSQVYKGIHDASLSFGLGEGIHDASLSFGPWEASGRLMLNSERSLDHEGHPLSSFAAIEAVGGRGTSILNLRDTPGSGEQSNTYGKVITVKHGNYSRKIGINGTPDAIKETIKTAFRLRRKRPFMLEDESNVIQTIDRDMPSGQYTLHFDEGVTIQVCSHDEEDYLQEYVEAKTFYGEDDFHNYLSRHGWSCMKECYNHRTVDNIDELVPGAIYRGGKSTSL